MSIKVGGPAPPVTVEAYVGAEAEPVTMEIGRPRDGWTILFFYPRDFTFVCPTELRGFAELETDFALEDARVVAASTDSWHVHRRRVPVLPGSTIRSLRTPRRSSPGSTACSSTTTARRSAARSSSIPRGSSGMSASPTRASAATPKRRYAS